MIRTAAIVVAACIIVSSAVAQEAIEHPPAAKVQPDKKARQVIDDAVAALGGEKFLKMEDRVETGRAYSFYNDRLSGLSLATIYTRYLTASRSASHHDLFVRERQTFGKKEETAVVLTEDSGANVTWRDAKPMPTADFERYRDTTLRNVIYLLRQRLQEPGMTFEFRGSDVVDHQPVDIVDIIDSENRSVTVYFHQSTKLPVKQFFSRLDPKTRDRIDEVTYYARYRTTDGIQWPQEITRERNGEKIYQIFSETVRFNQDLTDDLFSTTTLTGKATSSSSSRVRPTQKK